MNVKQLVANFLRSFPPFRWVLALAVRLFVPRHRVGAVGVVFNDVGQVLLVEHVFRPYYPWGLPGGWVEYGENPAEAVQREIKEELGLKVEVKQLLFCRPQGYGPQKGVPRGLTLAFYCRPVDGWPRSDLKPASAYEVLSTQWNDPVAIKRSLAPLDQLAINLAAQVFQREQPE